MTSLSFPPFKRYTGDDLPHTALCAAYGIAQYTATAVVRSFTNRDARAQLGKPPSVF